MPILNTKQESALAKAYPQFASKSDNTRVPGLTIKNSVLLNQGVYLAALEISEGPILKTASGKFTTARAVTEQLGFDFANFPSNKSLVQSERTGEFKIIDKPITAEWKGDTSNVTLQVVARPDPPTTSERPPDYEFGSNAWFDAQPSFPGVSIIRPGLNGLVTLQKQGK